MNTSIPSLSGANVPDSKSINNNNNLGSPFHHSIDQLGASKFLPSNNNSGNGENSNKNISPFAPVNETDIATLTASPTRRLIRTESTYEEDSFDESIRDLSHLNQRHVLRQQWFRKNNLVSRLLRSTSTASNSSSSSSGISSNIYSSCNATNTSSFGSSFSSSFSATLSSLSESCDQDLNICSQQPSNENDYPKILRKSSFKNKSLHGYKPYYKPRRFSLQLLKNNLEFSENFKLLSAIKKNIVPRSSIKYSKSCYSIGNKDRKFLWTMAATCAQSNPSSPDKNMGYHIASDPTTDTMAQVTQVVIDTSDTESNQPGSINLVGVNLVRSKSLDDLNTLFCCPNLCSSICLGHENNMTNTCLNACTPTNTNLLQQTSISHYSSFNRICDCPKQQHEQQQQQQQLGPNTGGNNYCQFSNQFSPLNISQMVFNNNNNNNNNNCFLKGISISSNQINDENNSSLLQTSSTSTTSMNVSNNNNNSSNANNPTINSLCDIDHVMKKISSLRV